MTESATAGWDNFYIMVGSSAAALMGLTFVVIALAADAQRVNPRGLRAFITPTIAHFGTVLALAAFLIIPRQNTLCLSWGFGVVGVAGLIYSAMTAMSMRQFGTTYLPVWEDWVWHVLLPILVYSAILAIALLVGRAPHEALYGVAAAAIGLLFIGIHNAWDVATSISMRKQPDTQPPANDS